MNSERDIDALSTWDRAQSDDREEPQTMEAYRCCVCDWTGRGGVRAFAHFRVTGHSVRGRNWPRSWGNALFGEGKR